MSRWNRVGVASMDKYETSLGVLDLSTWLWLREAIDDVFRYDPIDNVELFIRDGDTVLPVMDLELHDVHYDDGSVTREVIIRPNKKCKRRKYIG